MRVALPIVFLKSDEALLNVTTQMCTLRET